ncbi:ABC transporter ATP-binding protein [Bradyrhizobium sp. NP1]|uniref:ABC transporter ATP-binding protein n=1 Tax=Bradyrhizobium sp. NP1 TaxID=3049772 RepID=UPI0025A59D42|nr:ABC transporter ATP-binding protein [Bradyrhizobium sp. NP1]WJR77911.1 ABC transporter ATP-binding protein [Bradyrhizobium sp. NP1]
MKSAPRLIHSSNNAAGAAKALLEVSEVSVSFGGIAALRGVSFVVRAQEICGLIGPNGAGKTTLFNCVNGLIPVDGGDIRVDGRSLGEIPPREVVYLGVSRTFQNVGLYGDLSVLQNVQLGGHSMSSAGFLATSLRLASARKEEARLRAEALARLAEVGLAHLADVQASSLPYGSLKRVEIARALMSSPKLLMLDEPAGGLSHGEVDELGEMLRRLRAERGLTILLVEHHMRMVMDLCTHVVVMSQGAVLADGTPQEVQKNEEVAAVYFGSAA